MSRLDMIRGKLSLITALAAPLAAGIVIAVPAHASSQAAMHQAPAGLAPHLSVAPLPGLAPGTPATAATAASRCARYAARAGWAGNGYYGGDLVTAAAVCVAESGGDPRLYVCDENGKAVGHGDDVPGKPVTCPAGTTSYDRGLWQLNSVAAAATSDACAFAAACNAGAAYLDSGRGTTFAPWSSYDQDIYARYIDAAQAAVIKLTSGAVASALLGECLVQSRSAAGAKVQIANCGSGAATQQWVVTGGKLRSGSLCAAISRASATAPGIVLRRCAPRRTQQWSAVGRDELRNRADGKCLTDPGSSLSAGTQVRAARCTDAKDQTWWLP